MVVLQEILITSSTSSYCSKDKIWKEIKGIIAVSLPSGQLNCPAAVGKIQVKRKGKREESYNKIDIKKLREHK